MLIDEKPNRMRWIWLCIAALALYMVMTAPLVEVIGAFAANALVLLSSLIFTITWLVCALLGGLTKNRRFFFFLLIYWFVPMTIIGIIYPDFVTNSFCSILYFISSYITESPLIPVVDILNSLLGGAKIIGYNSTGIVVLMIYAVSYIYADARAVLYKF